MSDTRPQIMKSLSHILSRVAVLQVLWKKWDIRSFIIASFTFQLILILAAPFRKRTANLINRASLWLSYLLADWVAEQAIGLIIKATEPTCRTVSDSQAYLFAFWAQFILIHLGGPDTITALALEDNELWLRTALLLGMQAYGALGVLFRSTRRSGLWAATVLMFLAGIIKYLERVMSLFHGRLMDGLDDNPRVYANKLLMGNQLANVDLEDQSQTNKPLTNVEMVRDAFRLFHCHKRLFVDRKLSGRVRRSTREYLMRRTAEEAYKLLEIEFNFTYEAIYTKTAVIQKPTWKILRHIVLSLQVASLGIWCFLDTKGFPNYDVRITYALIVGAVAVDVLGFLRIQLSDWNIACLDEKQCWMNWRKRLYNKVLAARTRHWKEPDPSPSSSSLILRLRSWFRRVFLVRWSESIHQLVELDNPFSNIVRSSSILAVKKKGLSSEMWEVIFEMVRNVGKFSESKRYKMVGNGEEVDLYSLVDRALPTPSLKKDYIGAFWKWEQFTKKFFKEEERPIKEIKNIFLFFVQNSFEGI